MLFQETGVPDNVAYLALGLVMLFVIFGGWVASFFWRLRSLRRDMALLEQVTDEDGPVAVVSEPEGGAPTAPPT
jgi:hypothetical protein